MKALLVVEGTPVRAAVRPLGGAGEAGEADAWQREMEKAQAAMWLGHGAVGGTAQGIRHTALDQAGPARSDVTTSLSSPSHRSGSASALPESVSPAPPEGASGGEPEDAAVERTSQMFGSAHPASAPAAFGAPAFGSTPTAARPVAQGDLLQGIGAILANACSRPVHLEYGGPSVHDAPWPVAVSDALRGVRASLIPRLQGSATVSAPMVPQAASAGQDAVRVYCQMGSDGLMVWIGAAAHSGLNLQALVAGLQDALQRQSQRLSCVTCNGEVVWLASDCSFLSSTEEPIWPSKQ